MWFITTTPYRRCRGTKRANKMKVFNPRDDKNEDSQNVAMSQRGKDKFSFTPSIPKTSLI